MHIIKYKFKNIIHYFQTHIRVFYLTICVLFISSFLLVTGLGVHNRAQMNYDSIKFYAKNNLSGRYLQAVSAKYNDQKDLFRMDFYVSSDKEITSLTDKMSIETIAKTNRSEKIKADIVKVTPNYYVAYFKHIKPNYKVLKMNLDYSFTEDIKSNAQKDTELEFYIMDKDVKKDSQMSFDKNKNHLVNDYLNTEIHLLKKKIKLKEANIDNLKDKNKELNKQIKSIEADLEYKIGSEKEDLLSQIDELKLQITNNKNDIDSAKKSIKTQEQRIKLLNKQKK